MALGSIFMWGTPRAWAAGRRDGILARQGFQGCVFFLPLTPLARNVRRTRRREELDRGVGEAGILTHLEPEVGQSSWMNS